MTDQRGRLQSAPFSFVVRNDRVHISRGGMVVTTLGDRASARFLASIEDAGEDERQQLMARATGNYKRGNERRGDRGSAR